ncbi:hypothetical protein [Brevibacterium jeotgali]|uniref:Uncharacterized protein n=1 Tax=Brevibacterium jeotgali TaxID=1262550 RepID=A0A2H1L3F3_9MICO|nr:hypothetical protein [Brevibacterium jeotgali]TWC01673.1 hypothetical protein FB108_0325 [Brevibacterium jeotgali]SMY11418.1 hypothetical protein BJEO58_01003 [Brevibacterium jeotgali]
MTGIKLYPYPRIDEAVEWSEVSIAVDGHSVEHDELADRWDAHSTITLSVTATVPLAQFRKNSSTAPVLTLTAGCYSTAESVAARSQFVLGATRASASAQVSMGGAKIAQQLEVKATLTVPFGDEKWLERRVIAQRRPEKINLDSELSGFPTSAVSFKDNNWREAPWMIDISAVDLTDPFMHSIRLTLNLDYPRVVELVEGRAEQYVEMALEAAIIRALLQTARRLADESTRGEVDEYGRDDAVTRAIEEFPDSIAAAAEKTSRQYLNLPLGSVISRLRSRPEGVETLILNATQALKEKR